MYSVDEESIFNVHSHFRLKTQLQVLKSARVFQNSLDSIHQMALGLNWHAKVTYCRFK